MAFLDDLGKKITQVGQTAVQKTKDFTSVAKLNSAISDKEKLLTGIYVQIGKLYASKHTADCEPEFAEMIAKIKETEGEIADLRRQCQDIKGVVRCQKCGNEIVNNAVFCNFCGARTAEFYTADTQQSQLMKCHACGAMIEKDTKFCVSCGTPTLPTEQPEEANGEPHCNNCNAKLEADSLFCTNCGTKRTDI